MTISASFEVKYTQFLDPSSKVVGTLPPFAKDPKALIDMYKDMVLTRIFDSKAVSLQRTGRLGTFPSALGQEASSIGLAHAMKDTDVLVPAYRDHGIQLYRGLTMEEVLLLWGGDERGNNFKGPKRDFPNNVPVGTNAAHATGVAHAMKIRGEKNAVVCTLGDGATSKGDVYEAINMAGVMKLPILFFITNNQWAISVPRSAQSAAETLAQKAIAGGFHGEQVDGNDLLAVHHACSKALKDIRAGKGPHLIEGITYRLNDHTTADDASRYRDPKEVSKQWKEEPIARIRTYLADHKVWTKADEEKLIADCTKKVEKAVEKYMKTGPQSPETMFDSLYATLPPDILSQREDLVRRSKE